jgi:hypothetical protein
MTVVDHSAKFRAAIEHHFTSTTRDELLASFAQHMRSLKKITFDDQVPTELAKNVASRVTAAPWTASLEWYTGHEQRCVIAAQLQAQENYMEAYMVWSEVMIHMRPLHPPLSPQLLNKMHSLMYTGAINTAICCIHYLESVSKSFSTTCYQELGEYALDVLKTIDVMRYEEHLRAKYFLAFARITRLLGSRVPQYATAHFAYAIGQFLAFASRQDPSDPQIADEMERWEEWSAPIFHPNED